MSGVILSLTKSPGNQMVAWVEQAPTDHPDAKIPQTLDLSKLPAIGTEAATRDYAAQIRNEFLKFEAFESALHSVFNAPAGTPSSLKFQLRHPLCETFSWETLLNDRDDFLALSSRANVSRQIQGGDNRVEVQLFKPPLKIFAILSAEGVQARGQWEGFKQALAGALGKGWITLDLVVCEPALLAEINGEALAGVSVGTVPSTLTRLLARIADAAPNILHFFCHGRVGVGIQSLEMVPMSEWLGGESTGALSLSIEKLQAEASVKQTWLTVLNCCLGGAANVQEARSTHSMAAQLVRSGVSNAVGMVDPIDASDAHNVTEALYTKILGDLAPLLQHQIEQLDIDFSPAIGAARDALHQSFSRKSTQFKTWTLPVLYERAGPLRVRWAGAPGDQAAPPLADKSENGPAAMLRAMQLRIQLVAGYLKTLPLDAPAELRLQALQLLSGKPAVPEEFWPDLLGRFDAIEGANSAFDAISLEASNNV